MHGVSKPILQSNFPGQPKRHMVVQPDDVQPTRHGSQPKQEAANKVSPTNASHMMDEQENGKESAKLNHSSKPEERVNGGVKETGRQRSSSSETKQAGTKDAFGVKRDKNQASNDTDNSVVAPVSPQRTSPVNLIDDAYATKPKVPTSTTNSHSTSTMGNDAQTGRMDASQPPPFCRPSSSSGGLLSAVLETTAVKSSAGDNDEDAGTRNSHATLLDAIAKNAAENATVGSTQDPPGARMIPLTIVVSGEEGDEEPIDCAASKATVTISTEEGSRSNASGIKEETQFFFQEQYGLDGNPNEEHARPTYDVERRYAQALCFAIGSEGVYTEEQVQWITGLFRSKGYDSSIVEAVPAMLKESSNLLELELVVESKKLITEDLMTGSALIVYDMYRAAAVADFPQEQMCAIAMIAEEIGVGKFGQLDGIRKQVIAELELKKQRIKLLYPEGHPQLDEQYEELVGDIDTITDSHATIVNV